VHQPGVGANGDPGMICYRAVCVAPSGAVSRRKRRPEPRDDALGAASRPLGGDEVEGLGARVCRWGDRAHAGPHMKHDRILASVSQPAACGCLSSPSVGARSPASTDAQRQAVALACSWLSRFHPDAGRRRHPNVEMYIAGWPIRAALGKDAGAATVGDARGTVGAGGLARAMHAGSSRCSTGQARTRARNARRSGGRGGETCEDGRRYRERS